MQNSSPVVQPFWFFLWIVTLSMGWLLPNHYRPWMSFHSDVWVAVICSLGAAAVILRGSGPVVWHRFTLLPVLMLGMVWAQYASGLISMAGTAWISSAYILGLLLALLTGARWEANSPGQLTDGLFIAIGLAAILSVGLQLYCWFGLDGLGMLSMGGDRDRPSANFGQPNQLATFFLWALLAVAWGWERRRIGGKVAILMAAYLLFGLALTGSRAAWIGMSILFMAGWLWRGLWRDARLPWYVAGLAFYFFICVIFTRWLGPILRTASGAGGAGRLDVDDVIRMSSEVRPTAWRAFADAAWQHPWIGYGWNQTALAQMAVAEKHPALPGVFSYAHNLFLDLILWCGIPLGLLIAVALLTWLWKCVRAVRNAESALLVLFLLVIANHAMLELPLYWAYFLLPVGLVIGALHIQLGIKPVMLSGRWVLVLIWFFSAGLLTLLIRDYTRVEPSYQTLRLEWDNFQMTQPVGPPDVLLLTQWREYVQYARFVPIDGATASDIDHLRNVTALFPNIVFFNKLAMTLAMNHHPQEAQLWLIRMSKVAPRKQYCALKRSWTRESLRNPSVAVVSWPIKDADGFVCN